MTGVRSSRQDDRRSRGEHSATRESTGDPTGRADDHAVCPVCDVNQQTGSYTASLRASKTRRTLYRYRHLVAYDVIWAVMHGGVDLRHATVCVRRDSSRAGKLCDLRIVRLPRHLIRNIDCFRGVNIRAVGSVQEKCRGIDSSESPIPRLNVDADKVRVVRSTLQAQPTAF